MNLPGFDAEASIGSNGSYHQTQAFGTSDRRSAVEASFPKGRGFSTLPSCRYENCRTVVVYEQCGTAGPGESPPMCPAGTTTKCDNVCRWPSGVKGMM